jgi:hypothetical protein
MENVLERAMGEEEGIAREPSGSSDGRYCYVSTCKNYRSNEIRHLQEMIPMVGFFADGSVETGDREFLSLNHIPFHS